MVLGHAILENGLHHEAIFLMERWCVSISLAPRKNLWVAFSSWKDFVLLGSVFLVITQPF